jgi:hypothetical protein
MKKGVFWIIVLLFTAFASVTAQTAPNAGQTFYYKQTGVVRNGNRTAGDNTWQFITFNGRACFDSDKNGKQAGDGFLSYQGVEKGVHIYYGDTYWGKAHYNFYNDFARINIITSDGVIYIYEKTTPPANAVTSAYVYTRPPQILPPPTVADVPDRIQPPGNNNNQGTEWDTTPFRTERIKCSSCNGSGKCRVCHGSGDCTTCNGRGLTTYWTYTGRGEQAKKCGVCNGSGNCGTCINGSGNCRGCRGTGYYN